MSAMIVSMRTIGIQAEHRFVVSSEEYRQARTPLYRTLLRLKMYLEYPVRLAWFCVIDRSPRILVITTNTFYAPLIAITLSSRSQLVVHLVWDLFPDALVTVGRFAPNGWVISCVKGIVQYIFRHVSANVFLGQRLLKHAETKFRQVPKSYVIPVGANASVFADVHLGLCELHRAVDILYCGNFGVMHDSITLIEALKSSDHIDGLNGGFTLTFHASGPNYVDFKNSIRAIDSALARNVRLESSLNDDEWVYRMHQAQVALVTMKPGSEKVVMPSKTYSALAAGQAILAICPIDSDLAHLVIEEKCGWVVTPGKPEELLAALHEISTQRNLLLKKRKNAFQVGQSKFSNGGVAHEWVALINKLK